MAYAQTVQNQCVCLSVCVVYLCVCLSVYLPVCLCLCACGVVWCVLMEGRRQRKGGKAYINISESGDRQGLFLLFFPNLPCLQMFQTKHLSKREQRHLFLAELGFEQGIMQQG